MVKGGQVMDWPLQVDGWAAVMIIWGLMWHALIRILYILFAFFFFFLKRANPIWCHMVNILTKTFFHLTQIIMLLDTPHVIIAFGFFFSFCRNWSKLPYHALIDDVELTCMVPTIDRSNWIRMYIVQMVSQDVAKNNHNFTQISHLY